MEHPKDSFQPGGPVYQQNQPRQGFFSRPRRRGGLFGCLTALLVFVCILACLAVVAYVAYTQGWITLN